MIYIKQQSTLCNQQLMFTWRARSASICCELSWNLSAPSCCSITVCLLPSSSLVDSRQLWTSVSSRLLSNSSDFRDLSVDLSAVISSVTWDINKTCHAYNNILSHFLKKWWNIRLLHRFKEKNTLKLRCSFSTTKCMNQEEIETINIQINQSTFYQ